MFISDTYWIPILCQILLGYMSDAYSMYLIFTFFKILNTFRIPQRYFLNNMKGERQAFLFSFYYLMNVDVLSMNS